MSGPQMTRVLTHERLLEVLDYDPETGIFVWKMRLSRKFPVGRRAGGLKNGKFYVRIDEQDYTGARLAWFYVTGKWPHRLKFVDEDVANIRFGNLIETHALPEKYDHSTPEGRAQYLRDHRARYGDANKDSALRHAFGITRAEYQAKHDAQNGCCAICGKPETDTRNGKTIRLAVDHHHESGVIRDLLCASCNKLIGLANEDPSILVSAIAYLNRHAAPSEMVAAPNYELGSEFVVH